MAVTGDAKLWVAGAIDGDVIAPSARLTVAPGGRIRGDIKVCEARIEGTVQGDIEVHDALTLTGLGTVRGSITAVRSNEAPRPDHCLQWRRPETRRRRGLQGRVPARPTTAGKYVMADMTEETPALSLPSMT